MQLQLEMLPWEESTCCSFDWLQVAEKETEPPFWLFVLTAHQISWHAAHLETEGIQQLTSERRDRCRETHLYKEKGKYSCM